MTLRAHLRTARLVLRPLVPEDAPVLAGALNDFAISQWLARVPFPYAVADAEWFIHEGQFAVGHVWAICDGSGLVGVISIGEDFGYWLAPRVWGRGYATKAGRAVVAEWFGDPAAGDVLSGHFAGNAASRNVLTKLGFAETHHALTHSLSRETDVESVKMRLTRDAFAASNPLVIETDRLFLRPLRETDAADLRRIVTIPEVGRMLLIFPPDWTEEAARAFTHTWRWKGDAMFRLAVTRRGEDRLIGTIGIKQAPGKTEAAIFYFLDPVEGGQGYASEALVALLPEIARRFGPLPLLADVFTDNPGSARVLEKGGFIRTGTGMGISAARLEPAPIWLYRLDPQLPEACP